MRRALCYIACINATLLALASLLIFIPASLYPLWLLAVLAAESAPLIFCAAAALLFSTFRLPGKRAHPRLSLYVALLAATSILLSAWHTFTIMEFAGREKINISLGDCLSFKKIDPLAATKLDVREYGRPGGKPLELDVYQSAQLEPAGAKIARSHPAVVVVHGGGWRHGRRSDFVQYDLWLAGLGFTVFDLDYRLADGKLHFPAPIDDLDMALDWVEGHATEYGVDPERIALLGRSAGAQIVLVEAYRAARAGRIRVKCVVDLYGPTDLPWDYENPIQPDVINCREVLANYLGGTPQSEPLLYEQGSACSLVCPATPATLLIYGGRDQIVSHLNGDHLLARLMQDKVPSRILYMPWANHAFDWHFSGLSSQISRQAIAQFLSRYL